MDYESAEALLAPITDSVEELAGMQKASRLIHLDEESQSIVKTTNWFLLGSREGLSSGPKTIEPMRIYFCPEMQLLHVNRSGDSEVLIVRSMTEAVITSASYLESHKSAAEALRAEIETEGV